MACISNVNGKWRAQIYVMGRRDSKMFKTESDARAWAAFQEDRLRKKSDLAELLKVGEGIPNFPRRIVEAMYAAPLTYDEIVNGTIPVSVVCGIYFLVRGERIVYVGQSTNALRRIMRHLDNGVAFDSFCINPCPKEDLDKMEAVYITAFYPEGNMSLGRAPRGIVARMPSLPKASDQSAQ
jgi:hypothetical protein